MAIPDIENVVIARIAAVRLRSLYQSYVVTSRAHLLVLRRIRNGLAQNADSDEMRDLLIEQIFLQDEALARETMEVFQVRSEQLERRIAELSELGA